MDRLRRVGTDGDLYIERFMTHSFVSFPTLHHLPGAEAALLKLEGWLEDAFAHVEPPPAIGLGMAQMSSS